MFFIGILLFLLSMFTNCSSPKTIERQAITWRLSDQQAKVPGKAMEFVLLNKSPSDLLLDEWGLWFNAIYPIADTVNKPYKVINKKGNLYKIEFDKGFQLKEKDSIVIRMESLYAINNKSAVPNGLYFQNEKDNNIATDVKNYQVQAFHEDKEQNRMQLAKLYERNEKVRDGDAQMILPTPKRLNLRDGIWTVNHKLHYYIDESLKMNTEKTEAFLKEAFIKVEIAKEPDISKADLIIQDKQDLKEEAYQLTIKKEKTTIKTSGYAGLFYAIQSLKNLLSPEMLKNEEPLTFPTLQIDDEPRYAYRGQSIDIARNFHSKELLLKYIDILSSYKMNVLHLHLTDDEGWRIEIPSLPELTEIGSQRSAFYKNRNSIQPAYGSGAKTSKKEYLTSVDFVDILEYAAERCVKIIPEIETPGHARAAIKAMQTRYDRFMDKGNKEEAEKYMLYHPEDRSIYSSVQYFDDNVMDIGLPSTYNFISLIIDELKKMYENAGLELTKIHIGGDEVPNGVWEKSPVIQKLMKEQGFSSVYEVWPYYINKVRNILHEKEIEIAGWEEIGMVNKGKGMVPNITLDKTNIQVDVWNNVLGQGQEDLAYKLANTGYKTIIVGASNYYLDMAWNKDWNEPGFQWASHTDLYHSYSLLPEDYFANVHLAERAQDLTKNYFDKKERLTEEGRKNILGIKGALWSETILTDKDVDYMLLPRLFSIAERAWSDRREWEKDDRFDLEKFNAEYLEFANKIGKIELPKLTSTFEKLNYRLPDVGLKKMDGKLYANIEIPGFSIYYTQDGTEPTPESLLFSKAIEINKNAVYQFRAISHTGKKGKISKYE